MGFIARHFSPKTGIVDKRYKCLVLNLRKAVHIARLYKPQGVEKRCSDSWNSTTQGKITEHCIL